MYNWYNVGTSLTLISNTLFTIIENDILWTTKFIALLCCAIRTWHCINVRYNFLDSQLFSFKEEFLDFFFFFYDIQHSFICHPSESTVSEDARIEPRTVATTALAVSQDKRWKITNFFSFLKNSTVDPNPLYRKLSSKEMFLS
jgi:hypothetical protein